ncbi:hypothetical protein B7P43_G16537 [Cryptotermes secundus]|uniref:Uncharacterized protein n=1 Tax=Cryptotermes secundus TaxID=105785 RepID=A0A2J7PFG0_9NEOP|nr:hypothetical protein B7P43_G16537 [Cryptotermes secundus]
MQNTHDISEDGSFAIFRRLVVVILTGLLFTVIVNTLIAARDELRIMCILNHIRNLLVAYKFGNQMLTIYPTVDIKI